MGSSESKMAACAAVKPEPAIKNRHLSHLKDPRSPSTEIHRTPIQVGGPPSKTSAEVKSECPFVFGDPRSPSVGIARTPVREVMRATVGSFARRLGLIFHSEMEGKVPEKPQSDTVEEEELKSAELDSAEPLLTPRASVTFGGLAEHAHLLATPVAAPLQGVGDSSPFVVLEEPQMFVEIQTEADVSLEEAEEAKESPFHKRLSMSLITCHEGATPSQIFAEVHHDSTSPSVPSGEAEPATAGLDHLYALPFITVEPESPLDPPAAADESPVSAATTAAAPPPPPSAAKEQTPVLGSPASAAPAAPSPDQPQHRLTIDSKSPSQVVFKPQWLSKGFGATGPRTRAATHSGKGGSSPLAVSVAVKNATNENRGLTGKLRQRGSDSLVGRSPLQMKNNSPRERPQVKHKVSTPEKPRLRPVDRRVLAVGLDKENR